MVRPLALTLGEPAGIGPDITIGAWRQRRELELPPFYVVGRRDFIARRAHELGTPVAVAACEPGEAAAVFANALPVIDLALAVTAPPGRPDHSSAPAAIASIDTAVRHVLDGLAETLKRDYGVTNVKFWRKGFPAKGAPFIAEMAAESDVAISGVGHCGSSSPWSVIDAVNLEKAGIPTVALISRSFCPLGQIVGRGVGHQALPIVMLPHPIGEADEDRIAQKGRDAAAQCVRLLTTQAETVTAECAAKKFPLPEHAVARN